MKVTTYEKLSHHLESYLNQVTDDFEPIRIVRSNHSDAILVSAEEYDNMRENEFVLGNKTNRKWLEESKQQIEEGKVELHNIDI